MSSVTSTLSEIRQEQDYFDHAMDVHQASITRMNSSYSSLGTAVERRAMKKANESRTVLGPDQPAAFARMDLEDGQHYYIGHTSISDEDRDLLVINWQSKVASKFYSATPQEPQGLTRKRDFKTEGNRIKLLEDLHLQDLAEKLSELDGTVYVDDVLKGSLEASRTGEMKDIVRTIQAAQNDILRRPLDSLLVVQGGPGTGKTAVALHRVSWLLFEYEKLKAEDVLVIGPNPAFARYIQKVLPGLGNESVSQTSMPQLLQRSFKVQGSDPTRVAQIKGSPEIADVIANGLNDRIKLPTGPLRIRRRNSQSTVNILPETLVEDIERLRSEYYGVGREKLKERVLEHCAATLGLVRGGAADVVDPKSVETEVNKLWPQLSAPQFLRELLGSKARLRSAADGWLDEQQIEALYRPAAERITEEPWTLADLVLIDEAASNMQDRQTDWKHIVVDEAQDLSPMQIFALRRRSKDGSMTLVGDVAQSTGPFARSSWNDIVDGLRTNLPVYEETLEHGYRVPREVYEVASRLLPEAAPEITPPTIVREVGDQPELFDVSPSLVAREAAEVASHHSGRGRFVGVIAPAEWWDEITNAFNEMDMEWGDPTHGGAMRSVNLVTPEASKGLEFESVVVVDPQSVLDQDNGARLLYITLTRTTKRLDILAPSGEIPEIIADAFPHAKVIDEPALDLDPVISEEGEAVSDVATFEPDNADSEVVAASEPVASATASTRELSVPTPADVAERRKRADAAETQLTAFEEELISQNAEMLISTLGRLYLPEMQKRVLKEALRKLK